MGILMDMIHWASRDVKSRCNIYLEVNNRAKCFICGERLFEGDKVIRFTTSCWMNNMNSRRSHLVCWLSCIDMLPSTKELSQSKKVKILRAI